MDIRKRLIELLAPTSLNFEEAEYLADYLVKNGVTVQEQKSPCSLCGYGGKYLDAPPCTQCPAHPKQYKAQTNADRIRAMSDEELKKFICSTLQCKFCKFEGWGGCELLEWLQQPSERE